MKDIKQTYKKVSELSRFNQIFNPENLAIGFNVWIRSSAIQLILSVALAASGLINAMGDAGRLILLIASFALLQWAISSEAKHRFNIPAVPATAWFSVLWRVVVILFPVAFVLVMIFVGPVEPNSETAMIEIQEKMLPIQLILLFVTIVPNGYATANTLKKHLEQMLLMKMNFDDENGRGKTDGE